MNFVSCVTWISKGKAASTPNKLQLSPEELKSLVEDTKEKYQRIDEDDFEDDEKATSEGDGENDENKATVDDVDNDENNDDDFNARYNLDSYDNEDEDNPVFTINDLAVHVDNKDDEYVTDNESEGELEEKENFTIKDSDNLLVVGHVEDESSVLEIFVYNQENDAFYVHHDIVLPSYPLAIEWLDFCPVSDETGNFVAIGDMTPVIQIWDLDTVDVLESEYSLGEKYKKKEAKKIKVEGAHSDAVLSLSWNKLSRHLLASGSADSTVVLWDLKEVNIVKQFSFHSSKVQALQWHPSESSILLSGCTDGYLKCYDCRSEGEAKSWSVTGEIERVVWNLHDNFKFLCSTDQGYIHSIDMRNPDIECSFQAHNKAVTGLDISPLQEAILISASMDQTLKVWDMKNQFKLMEKYKLKVGSIYAAKTAPDLQLTVAVGGNNSSNYIKVIDIHKKLFN